MPFLMDWCAVMEEVTNDQQTLARAFVGQVFTQMIALPVKNGGRATATRCREHQRRVPLLPISAQPAVKMSQQHRYRIAVLSYRHDLRIAGFALGKLP